MNIICKVFGHKYNKADEYKQPCARWRCLATRWLTASILGKNAWIIIDIDKIKP